ncbi:MULTISPECIES: WYL domain-containing protein [Bradyrhizobium]|uniref:Transcriptional regulator n=1 Tax=Bradyrhizobium vignae TaxID=1549949 RepID=A0A2U3PU47_9BRAD|nr:WYL domain-containing protein [Bradyrhizobium vignae]SPP92644.1 Transcriptional regulator [Bradyrhizobium vignae]
MDKSPAKPRWGAEQRLEFIEFRLFWEGSVNRSDLKERFGVSIPQASADLAQYRERAPENLRYDSSGKRYLPSDTFEPRILRPNAERYLAQMRALAEDVISPLDTWMLPLTDVGVTPIPSRRVDPETLRFFLTAIRTQRSAHIEYQSLNDSRPEPMWRWITPHAFGTDGLRWHVRAFCHIERAFKDFIISRCLAVGQTGAPEAKSSDDHDWHNTFTVVLVPNPKLSAAQQKTIERDYGMSNGRCELKVRLALLYYFDKRLRLDVAEKQDRPKETPIVVANKKEYDKTLRRIAY